MTSPAPPLPPPPSPRLAVAGRLLLVVALLGVICAVVSGITVLVRFSKFDANGVPAMQVNPAAVQPGAAAPALPAAQPSPQAQGAPGLDPVATWADHLAGTVDIPARALRAYGQADLAMRTMAPRCRVSWATLAGIGRVESDHGRFGGGSLGADGRPSKPIVGVPLDGSGAVQSIADTDGGRLDGDSTYDRAVGPMQFIPSTWAHWASDGDGDGRSDPQDVDDAALATARYLCADGRDVGTPAGWWAGVLSYNESVDYAQRVFSAADTYARRSV
jgi:membrane-bound lytic murein transglycosylase B